ncbi:hypothetical protein NDU88_007458 [Pleurodeles waltl]|uniref:Uncharacterized protein n=1 Tax=Pleurodeles waltl TaxID=8319 RepID=A0AAV7RV03_PLEWA|nr:hypothetical protein NDU88_007458 [Pleurodeles waltl]
MKIREGSASASGPSVDSEDLYKILGSPKGWNKATGKDPKFVDWGKDSSDKFYSLTEESDLSSGDHSFGESDGSETSETGNKSSSNEPTVRQLRRQWKSVKSRPCSQEDFENSTSTGGRTLKWDYSGIGLADTPTTSNQGSVNGNMEAGTGAPASNSSATGTEAGMLQSIYSSMKELQTETRIESRRARVATKRLQGTVRKVAKSCTEIKAKLCSMEERIVAFKKDVDTLKEQSATRDDQLTDVMWKLEDFENRQRRNNLRFLGIPEGLEGSNIRTYMVKLLRGAFPELGNWDWENELQRELPNNTFHNMSSEELGALKRLTSYPTIMIKLTDKGGATVILPQQAYKDDCFRLLGNTQPYKRLSRDPTLEIQEEIAFLLSKRTTG